MQARYRQWQPWEEQYLIDSYAKCSVRQQAKRLGASYRAVVWQRARLIHEGKVAVRHRRYNRAWTQRERDDLLEWVRAGMSVPELARKLRRTEHSIYKVCEHHGGLVHIRAHKLFPVRSTAEVGALFGVSPWTVRRQWIGQGWLRAQRTPGGVWRVDSAAVLDFIEDRRYFMAWFPEKINDRALREYAHEQRAAAGGAWIPAVSYARQHFFHPATVNKWVRHGRVTATKALGIWYIWIASPELQQGQAHERID